MTCFSCASKKEAGDSVAYLPAATTAGPDAVKHSNYEGEEMQPLTHTEVKTSKSGNTVTVVRTTRQIAESNQVSLQLKPSPQVMHSNYDVEESQPLTHTEVKRSKSGNTVTVVKTTRTRVVKTQKAGVVSFETTADDTGHYENVSQIAPPTKTKRKRFNLKSVLSRNAKKKEKELVQPSEVDVTFQERCLWAHNQFRGWHGMKPLVLNKELCQYAAEWAQHLAKKNKLKPRKKNKYGENLALGTGTAYKPEDAVQSWYDEMEYYDFAKPGFSSNTGHFSQVVWQESTQLGIGVAQKGDRTWVVCNYDPPGNVLGQYEDNVVPPKDRQSKSKPRPGVVDKTRLVGGPEDTKPSTSQAFKKVEVNKNQKWSKFELECLESHNKFRAQHGCAPLTLNKNLCNLANDWATHLTKIRTMYHRPQNDYGENIYQITNREPTAEDAVKGWYDEITKYKYKKPGFSMGTGHFTQVVWLESTELGVGKAKIDNITFIVCNYNPPGNVMGQYKTQVPPIGGFKNNVTNATTTKKDCSENNNKTSDINGHTPVLSNKKSGFFNSWFKSKKTK